eukprot:Gb_05024 [translate_table: standard]
MATDPRDNRPKYENAISDGDLYHHLYCTDQGLDPTAMLWYNTLVSDAESGLNTLFESNLGKPESKDWVKYLVNDSSKEELTYADHKLAVKAEAMFHTSVAAGSLPAVQEQQQPDQISVHSEEMFKDETDPNDCKKKRKMRRTERGFKYTFLTRSDSDSIDDGYKWRKYGRKRVKSSPHPRSYFRCSDSNCCVKKTVERDAKDSRMLITTYEGQHNHQCPSLVYYIEKPLLLFH